MQIQDVLLAAPVFVFSVIAHEYAHGYAALKQGDTTALSLGRLTWNPIKHIDPFMTVILPLVLAVSSGGRIILGGAKPVPVNPRNYRNFKRGDIIVSLAGVAVNLLIAAGAMIVFVLAGLAGRALSSVETTLTILQAMMYIAVQLNLLLTVFNLLPIPPLDGSHVAKYLLPMRLAVWYQQVGRYGIVILVLFLAFGGNLFNVWQRSADSLIGGLLGPYALPTLPEWLA